MSEFNRHTLISNKTTFNQMRNGIYWLERFMKQSNLSNTEIADRFKKMGKNIGASYAIEYKPHSHHAKDLLLELYKITVNSKVKVKNEGNFFTVEDSKCALCKYQYPDIDVAGCTVEMAMIAEMMERNGYHVKNMMVVKSKTYGDNICTHQFELEKVNSNE